VPAHDTRFTEFWRIFGTSQWKSTAFHPQTDGQTERTSRTLEDMLRHYVGPSHHDWDNHLAAAEFAINNSYQESIKTTPFCLNIAEDSTTPMNGCKESKVPAAWKLPTRCGMTLSRQGKRCRTPRIDKSSMRTRNGTPHTSRSVIRSC